MKFFASGKSPPNLWDFWGNRLDELIFEKFWKKFKVWGRKFLIKISAVVLIFICLTLYFASYRVSSSLVLSVPGIHETYEWLFLDKSEKVLAENVRKQLGYFGGNLALSFIYNLDSVKSEKERENLLNKENLNFPEICGFKKY